MSEVPLYSREPGCFPAHGSKPKRCSTLYGRSGLPQGGRLLRPSEQGAIAFPCLSSQEFSNRRVMCTYLDEPLRYV